MHNSIIAAIICKEKKNLKYDESKLENVWGETLFWCFRDTFRASQETKIERSWYETYWDYCLENNLIFIFALIKNWLFNTWNTKIMKII